VPASGCTISVVLRAAASSITLCLLCLAARTVAAEESDASDGSPEPDASDASDDDADPLRTVIVGARPDGQGEDGGRTGSVVSRPQIQERQPRSAPDALRYEPGASVQQTAHGQASVYLRGLTGQQTVMLFDGIRLNNATFRQGPNQYFFTVDSHTVSSIEVIRGSASVLYGSDALGGVILAMPVEPVLREGVGGFRVVPRTSFSLTTADSLRGGRFEAAAQAGRRVAFVGGVGYRAAGLLEAGGIVRNPADGEVPQVPRFADDGRTQLGTGFDEATFDGRLLIDLGGWGRVTAAAYGYRELDAPRTDQCPAAFAPWDECLTYEEQFRDLAYVAWDGGPRLGRALETLRVSLSYQRQHERRRLDRPSSFTQLRGVDDAHTIGLVAAARTARWRPRRWVGLALRFGTDLYVDWLASEASTTFTDVDVTVPQSRGLYIDGSSYVWWGLFVEGEALFPMGLTLRAGGRLAATAASAPADEASSTAGVDQAWVEPVGRGGVEWAPLDWLAVLLNVDQGFRAPNLDDLTSRQQTGPGFQFENAALEPERSLTVEAGLRVDSRWFGAEASFFWTRITGAMLRAPRTSDQCPPSTPGCVNSWNRFQLVNADEPSEVLGTELEALARFPGGFSLRATLAYAYGEGPNPGDPPTDPGIAWDPRVPLSRIPPLNGTVELLWRWRAVGLYAGAALRWAATQDRLAISDQSDARIPLGGTPGYVVLDLRAGYRLERNLLLSLVFENVTDAAYRVHGSSINGPGRGLLLTLELGL
jgi:iron complex outermembrane receptor protein/hemoglobin/transferrin/lactoferrin receptor protein